ncbi:gastric triacylglycerol lipase isoform X2 [Nomia melanderi]|nr:gastric triacylglycerol lipase-like isoform X2 [Nomia melanderi]
MMSLLRGLVVLQFFVPASYVVVAFHKGNGNPDVELTAPALIRKYGYPVEAHNVITEDGYILEIHRIPHGRNNKAILGKPPILLQHGLTGSSADWILKGPSNSLAYILADAGYDVWLGNNRGNIYSKNHTSISLTDRRFWDFSYHELGDRDLPATIDYILDQTRYERLSYIGHSQGTTQFWVMMSKRPNYNGKIALMIGLAPVAFTGNMRGPITKLAKLTYMGVRIGEKFGYPEIRARSGWGKLVTNLFCKNQTQPLFCNNFLFLITGFDQSELSGGNRSVILGHIPAGASWKQAVHFGQGFTHKDHFREYDYDNEEKNFRLYNSLEPPEYDLNKVTAPVALFSSNDDLLATPEDVNLLKKKLANVVFHDELSNEKFSHYDFIWGKYCVTLIFEPILKLLAAGK